MATERNTNDVLRLNVGGKHFVTRRGTLCVVEGSLLEKMFRTDSNFAPATELQGEIFLDRDPMAFGHVLNYLRDGCRLVVDLKNDEAMLQRLRVDADYFGLKELVDECGRQLRSIPNNDDALRLNVGGKHFVTRRGTLCTVEGSLLKNMFRTDSNFAPTELQGEIFLDRNPMAFGHVLDYLRDGCRLVVDLRNDKAMLQRLRTDAGYFGLKELTNECDMQLRIDDEYEYEDSNRCHGGSGWKMFKIYQNAEGKTRFVFEKVTD